MTHQLPTASDLITEAWKNVRRHWPTYLEFLACYLAFGAIQWGVAVATRLTVTTGSWLTVLVGGSVLNALLLAYISVALIDNVWHGLDDDAPHVFASLRGAKARSWPFVVVSVLAFLASLGGLLLLVIGTFVFFFLYRFAGYAAIVDRRGAWASLGESRRLLDGRFWSVAWRITATYVYFFMLTNLLTLLQLAAAGAFQGDLGLYFGPINTWSSLPGYHLLVLTLAPTLASAVTMPLLTASDLRLWRELKKA
jgi:hypothetical protein